MTRSLPMVYAMGVPGAEPLESVSYGTRTRLTREQLVTRIMELNSTATVEYLGRFGEEDLRLYLGHLQAAQVPRGPGARWQRPTGEPGIVSRIAGP
jgi:hypothetical protein